MEKQFSTEEGKCVLPDSFDRCIKRAEGFHITLAIVLVLWVVLILYCVHLKKKEVRVKTRRINQLKIEHANTYEEDIKVSPRASQKYPLSARNLSTGKKLI